MLVQDILSVALFDFPKFPRYKNVLNSTHIVSTLL